METMKGILKQELARLRETERGYLREIAKLPRGTLQEKKIKGNVYLYWVSSKKSKITYKCVNSWGETNLNELKSSLEQRKKYAGLLKGVRSDMKRIAKILHGTKRPV